MPQVELPKRATDGRDMDADAFLLLQDGLQLGEGDVALSAHLATYQLMLPPAQARTSPAAMPARRQFSGRARQREHLFDKADADAEPLGDGGNRVMALFVGSDDALT